MTTYHIGYAASPALVTEVNKLLAMRPASTPAQLNLQLEKVVEVFIPNCLDMFLLQCCEAIGLGNVAMKVVHAAVDTINSASNLLVSQLLKKRSDEEVMAVVDFIDRIFLRAEYASNASDSAVAEISEAKFREMKYVMTEIQAGRSQQVQEQLHVLMIEVADIVLEGFMLAPITLFKLNFLMRKVCDGAIATTKGATHMVVNRVFKKLNEEELHKMSVYFDTLLLTSTRN